MTQDPKSYRPTEEEWRKLARQAVKEQNPEKIVALAQLIVEAYQEEKRKGPCSARGSRDAAQSRI